VKCGRESVVDGDKGGWKKSRERKRKQRQSKNPIRLFSLLKRGSTGQRVSEERGSILEK
jgi:hypothetical protein